MIELSYELRSLLQKLKKNNSETYFHSLRTKKLTNDMIFIAERKGLASYTSDEIDIICKGAMLHDIGKLDVSNYILTKDSSLESDERKSIHKHVEYGVKLIADFLEPHEKEMITNIVLYHHERIDGSGYLGKTDIPFYVCMISICDVFDALHSDRVYCDGIKTDVCLDMIKSGKCGDFDESLFQCLEEAVINIDENN